VAHVRALWLRGGQGAAVSCGARQQQDVMQCARCGTYWDVGDKDRPACKPRSLAREKAMLALRDEQARFEEEHAEDASIAKYEKNKSI
jgi:hypothetical protein